MGERGPAAEWLLHLVYLVEDAYNATPLERAVELRTLYSRAHDMIAAARDEAIHEALQEAPDPARPWRHRTYREVGEAVGLSVSGVGSAAAAYRAWLAAQPH